MKKILKLFDESKPELVKKGAYILKKEQGLIDGIIIATGTEVQTAVLIAEELKTNDLNIRVVSMPNRELFLKQDSEYKLEILPVGYKKIVIEAGSSLGWDKFVYSEKYLFTIDEYGISGSAEDVLKYMKFDFETLKNRALELFKK